MKRFSMKPIVTACAIAMATAATPVLAGNDAHDTSSDLWAKASLTTTYTLNRQLNPFKIETEVDNGVATLTGTVDSAVERDLAEELAMGVDGITKVDNKLKIVPDEDYKEDMRDDTAKERSFMRKVEDANLTAKVKSQLLWNSSVEGLGIDVDTMNGKVTLKGHVETKAESDLAEQIAMNTDGVMGVDNKLTVTGKEMDAGDKVAKKADKVGEEVSDGWIATKVKSALIYNRGVDGTDIDVDVKNGVVTLHGKVDTQYEADKAVSIARSVKGVKSVETSLQDS